MDAELVQFSKWLAQQTPAVVVAVLVIKWLFQLIQRRDDQVVRMAEEMKKMSETTMALTTTLSLLFNRIKGGEV